MSNDRGTLTEAYDAAIADLRRPRMVRREGDFLVIAVPGWPDYEISLRRCDTPAKLLGWIRHITPKRWASLAVVRELIDEADAAGGGRLSDRGM